jgi:hypothetical protein
LTLSRTILLALLGTALVGCADPCVDDGVLQKTENQACPGQASADAGESSETDSTASATTSFTQGATASAGTGSQSGTTDGETAGEADATAGEATAGEASATGAESTGDPPESCTNGVQDGDESDIDCGGSCPKCQDGDMCNQSSDCVSDQCTLEMTCGGENECSELIDDNGCQACIKASCCPEVMECLMDEFCACWLECISHNNDFDPCVQECMGTMKPGQITSCANSQCNEIGACGD